MIGVDEIAKMIWLLKDLLNNSYTVSLNNNPFYTLDYNCHNNFSNRILAILFRAFCAPIILGFLMNKSNKFFYIWKTGFLVDRELEFRFLKAKEKKIICMFVGSDIRSLVLIKKFYEELDIDGHANYVLKVGNENAVKNVAKVADQYADIIFNASVDQMSYIHSKQYYPFCIYDAKNFARNDDKYNDISLKRIKILHSPSNPILKATQLVRAAIKKLRLGGYSFEYVELQNVDNSVVLEHLSSSHLVLDEFYSFALGVFGVEALANHCALLASADPSVETGMPQQANPGWLITPAWDVYDNLKYLLDNPDQIKVFADIGYEYAYRNFTVEPVRIRINKVFQENGVEI